MRLCVLLLILLLTVSARAQNVALGRPVTASGALWPGLPASNLTDGNHLGTGTIAHPATGVATLGFYFQVDLAADLALNRVVLYNRSDCCPERLTTFRVTLYADAAGIDTDGPGFKKIIIHPHIPSIASNPDGKPLDWVRASYEHPRGRIVSAWKRDGGKMTYEVTIPANTTAHLKVPLSRGGITESGKPLIEATGLSKRLPTDNGIEMELDSGSYHFEVSGFRRH